MSGEPTPTHASRQSKEAEKESLRSENDALRSEVEQLRKQLVAKRDAVPAPITQVQQKPTPTSRPVTVVGVPKPVKEIEGVYVKTIPISSDWCCGMAVNASETLMAVTCSEVGDFDHGNRLFLHSLPDGEVFRTIGGWGEGPGQFASLRRACFGPDDVIIVADLGNNRLQEFSSTGKYKRSIDAEQPLSVCVSNDKRMIGVGSYGCNVVLLDYGSGAVIRTITDQFTTMVTGVQFTRDDTTVLATDYDSTNVKLFAVADGSLVRSMCEVLGESCKDLRFAANGDIIVADERSNRICVFTPDGSTLKRQFGRVGTGDGQFKQLTAVSLVNGRLYVLDYGSPRVQVFE